VVSKKIYNTWAAWARGSMLKQKLEEEKFQGMSANYLTKFSKLKFGEIDLMG
jgi:hypothetical protein